MRNILLSCLILYFNNVFTASQSFGFLRNNPPPPPGSERRKTEIFYGNFTQKIDHFDLNNNNTFNQRYFVNDEFFDTVRNNVVFLMLGGEGDAAASWMESGSWIVSARKYGALLFQLEHRFYGESQPFPDLETENLRYLSSEQAIADAADFIRAMNVEYSLASDTKWIAFGGSYSASLATWLRLKEPDLVYGAVAASAPLFAKLDFFEYFQVVIDDLANVNEKCVDSLSTAVAQLEELINNPTPTENVSHIFNLCEPIEEINPNDHSFQNFYNSITTAFAAAAQFNGLFGTSTVDNVCELLTNENSGTEIVRLSNVVKLVTGDNCISYKYMDEVKVLREVKVGGILRQWFYQTCTEFGWYQTTNRDDKIFGRGCSVQFYTNMCVDVFGPAFNSTFTVNQINGTNVFYGGTDINVSNVVHVHGSMDPWHAIGLTETTNPDSPVIYIEGACHCATMYDYSENDSPQLIEARAQVDRQIGQWLGFQ